jgi:hypothetical protein
VPSTMWLILQVVAVPSGSCGALSRGCEGRADVDEGWALGIAWTMFVAMLVTLAFLLLRRRG